jgi:hypothetical protein
VVHFAVTHHKSWPRIKALYAGLVSKHYIDIRCGVVYYIAMQAHLCAATAGANVIAGARRRSAQRGPPCSVGAAGARQQLLRGIPCSSIGGSWLLLHRAPPLTLVDAARLHMTVYWVNGEQNTACHEVKTWSATQYRLTWNRGSPGAWLGRPAPRAAARS